MIKSKQENITSLVTMIGYFFIACSSSASSLLALTMFVARRLCSKHPDRDWDSPVIVVKNMPESPLLTSIHTHSQQPHSASLSYSGVSWSDPPTGSSRGLCESICLYTCLYMQACGHGWSYTWPRIGTATAETYPKSVAHISVEVVMDWKHSLNSIFLNEKDWTGSTSSHCRLYLAAAQNVLLCLESRVMCICTDRVMAAGVVWEEAETEGGKNGELVVRGEKRGAVSFPGRAPCRIHLHLRSHLSPCRSSPRPTSPPPCSWLELLSGLINI